MGNRVLLRVLSGLVYLGVLAAVVGAVLGRITTFEGRVVVAKQRTESLALRPAGGGGSFSMTRSMPLDVLPLDNPQAARALLDPKKNYDAMALGLRLRLDDVQLLAPVSERDVIETTTAPGRTLVVDARPGAPVPLVDGTCTVRAVEPWAGLVREASGRRMASFSFQREGAKDWVQGLFTEAGQWTILAPEMALRFDWAESEDAAKAGLPPTRPGLESARWAVLEKGRVHWFETLAPGTGQTLADGTEYVLLAVNSPPGKVPSLTVGIRNGGKARRVDVPANTAAPVDGLRFEHPGAMPLLIAARAWRDGAAWLVSFGPGGTVGPLRLEEGGEWQALPGLRFRLDQAMQQGLPVGVRGAPVWMAALSFPDGTALRLREGMSVRRGEGTLRYRRLPRPPKVRYQFQALSLGGGEPIDAFTLGPGEAHRVREWLITQTDDHLGADKTAVLSVRRFPASRPGVYGLAVAAVGAVGWMWAQFRLRDRRGAAPVMDDVPHPDADPRDPGIGA